VEEHLAERRERRERLRDLGAPAVILENEERRIAKLEEYPEQRRGCVSWKGGSASSR
jgi:hypothetical protein